MRKKSKLELEAILPNLKLYMEANKKDRTVRNVIKKIGYPDNNSSKWQYIAEQIYDFNEAIINDKDVHAVCVKFPRGNLDTGKHYFDVYYISNDRPKKFWVEEAMPLFGAELNNRYRFLSKWLFSSGVIGMDRLLHATDTLFYVLRTIGGSYMQIHCIN